MRKSFNFNYVAFNNYLSILENLLFEKQFIIDQITKDNKY